MSKLAQKQSGGFLAQAVWWVFLLICLFYGGFAFYMGSVQIGALLGTVSDAKQRAAPYIFVVHAFAGGIAILIGPLQFNRRLLSRARNLHRWLGRIYVWSIWIASIGGLWSAIFFDRPIGGRIMFGLLAVLWFAATTIALLCIRAGKIAEHRAWMIRSFALSFFFVTFSLVEPGLTATSLPYEFSYPLAVFLSWGVNMLVAEIWIWRSRTERIGATFSGAEGMQRV